MLQSNNGKDGTLTITVVHNFGTRQITSTKTVNADFKWNMDHLAIGVSGMVFPFGSGSMPHSIVITFNSLPTSSAGNLPSTLSIDGSWKLSNAGLTIDGNTDANHGNQGEPCNADIAYIFHGSLTGTI